MESVTSVETNHYLFNLHDIFTMNNGVFRLLEQKQKAQTSRASVLQPVREIWALK